MNTSNTCRTSIFALSIVLCAGCDGLFAPKAESDRIIWRVPSGAPKEIAHDPVANADRSMVYFVTPDYRLKKIRGTDGHVVFEVPVGGPFLTFLGWNAVLAEGIVAVSKVDVFAFDTATGAAKWTYVAPDGEETGYSSLSTDGSTVFAGGRLGKVHAIDARTGTARWIVDLSGGHDDVAAFNPVYIDETLFVCTFNSLSVPLRGTLWALNASNGAILWSYGFQPELADQGSACYGNAAIWKNLVIMPQSDGRIFAFQRSTGEIQWIAPRVHNVALSPGEKRWAAVAGNTLVVTNSSLPAMVVAYDPATGEERWRVTELGGSLCPPVLDSSTVYIDHVWKFAAYDATTGKLRWQTREGVEMPDPPIMGRPIIAGDRIYVAGRDGSYALKR